MRIIMIASRAYVALPAYLDFIYSDNGIYKSNLELDKFTEVKSHQRTWNFRSQDRFVFMWSDRRIEYRIERMVDISYAVSAGV